MPHECRVVSAHRTPELMAEFAASAEARGIAVIIAGAGGAAHLPGMVAAQTLVPVLGVPVESHALKGMDSLLSIVQMPGGMPVGTLAIGKAGATNAALARRRHPRDDAARTARATARIPRGAGGAGAGGDAAVSAPILPGATVGVLGSGQLGRMFALAARRMGYRVHTFSPERDTPTGQVADARSPPPTTTWMPSAPSRGVDVVTFEFENVPAATVEAIAASRPVRPGGAVAAHDAAPPPREDLPARSGLSRSRRSARLRHRTICGRAGGIRLPGRPEDRRFRLRRQGAGEDRHAGGGGRGVRQPSRAVRRARSLRGFRARGLRRRGARDWTARSPTSASSRTPTPTTSSTRPSRPPTCRRRWRARPSRSRAAILEALDVVGVLCVEFFLTRHGELLVNELAPRPHNSGHLTIDACVTSQFEQQLRAVCGLPLGSTKQLRPAAMANLLGDLWQDGEPDWAAACAFPQSSCTSTASATPRPGRKMGHLTALATDDR